MDISRYENPDLLWLLLGLVPMVAYYIYRLKSGRAAIFFSSIEPFKNIKTIRWYLRHIPFVLRLAVIALLIIVVARPQSASHHQNQDSEGIDIVLALDISSSMLARDFKPDRLTAAKDILSKFIIDRPTDRIGLVVFAGEAFTQVPLTTDHRTLVNMLHQVEMGMINDGTAIGNGLATAVNRLKESEAPSKVIVLLTDGVNNTGQIDPGTAAYIAKDEGIKLYTIGVGTEGTAPYPVRNAWGDIEFQDMEVEIDEQLLDSIATQTGGQYFRATDNTKLSEIYAQINELETVEVEIENFTRYNDIFYPFLLAALLLLLCEIGCKYFLFRQLP